MAERMPILEAMIAAVPFPADAAIDVLDVGAGAGVVSEAVLEAFPAARLTLQDFSDHMLARARESEAAGATEILYTPAGDDLVGQAEAFYAALRPLQGRSRAHGGPS